MRPFIIIAALAVIMLAQQQTGHAQIAHVEALSNADTTHFSVNSKGGWLLYNSYLATSQGDSIRLELILQRNDNISWHEWQQLGTIKAKQFRPETARKMTTRLQQAELEIEVRPDGGCYLRVASGDLLQKNQVVIPFIIVFKK